MKDGRTCRPGLIVSLFTSLLAVARPQADPNAWIAQEAGTNTYHKNLMMSLNDVGDRLDVEIERDRRRRRRRVLWIVIVWALFLIVPASLAYLAWLAKARAEANLALARQAVDESLYSADRDPEQVGADVPQVQELRRELLEKAERFYSSLTNRWAWTEASRRDVAWAHFRLGHINRMSEKPEEAAREYREAIARFEDLTTTDPANAEYRAALGNAFHWLGETFRPTAARYTYAEQAYDNALRIQQALVLESPGNVQYQEDLARTHYNRGMLRTDQPAGTADADFRESIRLLEPLASDYDSAAQALARTYNNLGSLLAEDPLRTTEVQGLWEKAIAIDERLVIKDPGNREYKLELATFCNKLAALLSEKGNAQEALRRSQMAVDLIENLSRPAPSLAITRADAHNLRGTILQTEDGDDALSEYEEALVEFTDLQNDRDLRGRPEFHQRVGDLLLNLATFPKNTRDAPEARRLLSQAVRLYAGVAGSIVASGSRGDAQTALDNLARVLPSLTEPERAELTEFYLQLQRRVEGDKH